MEDIYANGEELVSFGFAQGALLNEGEGRSPRSVDEEDNPLSTLETFIAAHNKSCPILASEKTSLDITINPGSATDTLIRLNGGMDESLLMRGPGIKHLDPQPFHDTTKISKFTPVPQIKEKYIKSFQESKEISSFPRHFPLKVSDVVVGLLTGAPAAFKPNIGYLRPITTSGPPKRDPTMPPTPRGFGIAS